MFREFIKPVVRRVIEIYKKNGKRVFFHSSGNIMEIVGDLIEVGVNILNPIQARANNLPVSMLGGDISPDCPASVLKEHKNVFLFLDRNSAKLLEKHRPSC